MFCFKLPQLFLLFIIAGNFFEDLDLLSNFRSLIALRYSSISFLLSPFSATFLPIVQFIFNFPWLVYFFSLVFLIIKGMKGFAFGQAWVADLTVSQRSSELIFGIKVMSWLVFMTCKTLRKHFLTSLLECRFGIKGLSEYIGWFLNFIFLLLMCPTVKVRCFIRESLPKVWVFVWQPFDLIQIRGRKWLVTAVFGKFLRFIVGLIDCELVGTFFEVDWCLQGIGFAWGRWENWEFLLHCFILIIKWLYICQLHQAKNDINRQLK